MSDKPKSYPALSLEMGDWNYYSVSMKLKDVAENFIFASSLGEPTVLDDMLQRIHKEQRSFGDMADFLARKPDHFYGSIVVACLDEVPTFNPILPPEDLYDELEIKEDIETVLGYLSFQKGSKYYILDGQHRVSSIQHVIEEKKVEPSFEKKQINVLVVTGKEGASDEENKIRYRRLFTSLNRYAVKMDDLTSIAMDEDDFIAIITRRLVENFEFFSPDGLAARDNQNINMRHKNLKPPAPFFTSLDALYKMNLKLVETNKFSSLVPIKKKDKQIRPPDALLSELYQELLKIWKSFVKNFPELSDPSDRMHMRESNQDLSNEDVMDHALLRPIVQMDLLAPIIVDLLGDYSPDELDELENYDDILSKLKDFQWDLRLPPWRDMILIEKDPNAENIEYVIVSSSERKKRVQQIYDTMLYAMGIVAYDEEELEEHKNACFTFLVNLDKEKKEEWWNETLKLFQE